MTASRISVGPPGLFVWDWIDPVAHATGKGCVGLPGLNRMLTSHTDSFFHCPKSLTARVRGISTFVLQLRVIIKQHTPSFGLSATVSPLPGGEGTLVISD